MSLHPPDEDHGTTSERFEYFMIRVTRSDQDPDRVSGLVERLGSGEKRSFQTGDQLLRMVGGWFESSLNLQSPTGHRNPGGVGSTNSMPGDGA
ncbi:MAG TPA: hypothetical protein VNO19_13135 [Gemmatimonadales bacterium]|nr:hypothetical protein [Gemmatimonadales bacterium]